MTDWGPMTRQPSHFGLIPQLIDLIRSPFPRSNHHRLIMIRLIHK